jgi:hypothetical protein
MYNGVTQTFVLIKYSQCVNIQLYVIIIEFMTQNDLVLGLLTIVKKSLVFIYFCLQKSIYI